MTYNFIEEYDIIVIGAGHAGVEASLATSRMGCKVLLATINIEMLAFMPCNRSILVKVLRFVHFGLKQTKNFTQKKCGKRLKIKKI